MDAPVVAAIISSSVAVLVAVGSAVRADLQRATDRRYDRRRAFLVDAQDAALALRDALREFGTAARTGTDRTTLADLDRATRIANGRLSITASRLEDDRVIAALVAWRSMAATALVDPRESSQADEDAAFDELNRATGAALRSTRGVSRQRGSGDS